jgi:multimeric flavodoxin WrbA
MQLLPNEQPVWWICALTVSLFLISGTMATAERPSTPEANDAGTMQVLVAYYSLRGNTEKFARHVVVGAERVPNTRVTIKRVEDVTKQDLDVADAIALGAPTYFANIPGEMKVVIDNWNWKWKVDFTDKIGGAFSTGGGQTAGKEFVCVSLLLFMINNRMVVAGPLYEDAEGEDKWGELGSSAMTGPLDPGVSEKEFDAAHRLGHRLATLAHKFGAQQRSEANRPTH